MLDDLLEPHAWLSKTSLRQLTNDVEIVLGILRVLLQESSDEPVGVLCCVSVIGDVV